MDALTGTYDCKIDAKGRVMVPASLKKQLLPVLQAGFVLRRSVFQKCLELYPMDQWQVLMQKINTLNKFEKKNNDFIRRFNAGVKVVDVDANGRLLVPKDLKIFAKLSKDIVIASAINIIEIWDKDLYEQVIEDATVDFSKLAEEVMKQNKADHAIS